MPQTVPQARSGSRRNLVLQEPQPVPNRPPVATADEASTRAGEAVTINVLRNDRDPDGDAPGLASVLGDLSFKLTYTLQLLGRDAALGVSFFNVLDPGYELSEYVFSGGTRDPNELNIPRSMRLSLTLSR